MKSTKRLALEGLAVVAVTFVFLRFLLPFFMPFVLAFVVAAVLDPVVTHLERRGVPRGVGVGVLLGLFVALTGVASVVVFSQLIQELEQLIGRLPEYRDLIRDSLAHWTRLSSTFSASLPHPLDDLLTIDVDNISQAVRSSATTVLKWLQGLPNIVVGLFVAAIATYFLSRDRPVLAKSVIRLVPRTWRSRVLDIKGEVFAGIFGFIRAQAILVFISTGLAVVGLYFLNAPYPWLLAFFAGFLDLVPMIGPSGVFIPLIVAYFMGAQGVKAIMAAAVWLVIMATRQMVEPRILGASVGLHPLTVLVAVYVGAHLFGIAGFFLGPLSAIFVKAIFVVALLPQFPGR